MRLRVAEIDQHPVAHVFGDKAGEPRRRNGDAAVVGADDLAQILRIEADRQRGRADQIAEHYGQLPPLGLARRSRSGGARHHRRRQAGDRFEQPTPVTDRDDTHFPQIVGGQL
jgi:hypothetical protein